MATKKKRTDEEIAEQKYQDWLGDLDERAISLAKDWIGTVNTLKTFKPEIEAIKEGFAEIRKAGRDDMIFNCPDFKTFCIRRLKRTPQGVYAMLENYNAKAKAKAQRYSYENILDKSASVAYKAAIRIHDHNPSLSFDDFIDELVNGVRTKAEGTEYEAWVSGKKAMKKAA